MINNLVIQNVRISGLPESIKASKYPMSVNVERLNGIMDKRQIRLATSPTGSGHDCWLKGVNVQFDMTITVKALVQAERYHFFDIVSSQSTMHRIQKMDISESCIQWVDPLIIARAEELKTGYLENPTDENFLKLIYSFPVGLMLRMRITTNYMQLKTIYHQRKYHRLPEWEEFCNWIESLPYSFVITGNSKEIDNYLKEDHAVACLET